MGYRQLYLCATSHYRRTMHGTCLRISIPTGKQRSDTTATYLPRHLPNKVVLPSSSLILKKEPVRSTSLVSLKTHETGIVRDIFAKQSSLQIRLPHVMSQIRASFFLPSQTSKLFSGPSRCAAKDGNRRVLVRASMTMGGIWTSMA